MKSVNLIIITVIVILFALLAINENLFKNLGVKGDLNDQIYSYLESKSNQKSVFNAAVDLNNHSSSNACVFFMAEVLRREGIDIPKETGNTAQIISILEEKGFRKVSDYRNLRPGDIVFTTDENGDENGVPSHTYVFMKWIKEGSYDYAYICDNQAKDYENQIYHIRNIKDKGTVNGITKDAFSFFMRPV